MHSKFGFLSCEISHVIHQRFNKKTEKLGLTHSQWRALVHLSENEDCRQIDLADILEVKPITLARLIDSLEEADLVKRNKDTEDRRAYRLKLTSKAYPLMQKLWEIADAIEDQVLEVLTPKEQESLINMLALLKDNIALQLSDKQLPVNSGSE